ncbi:MAG: glycosyltransferase [Rhodobacteraceae bacterium]|nr:glycosyltransferase [Paracoccaceae bacterium]
MTAPRVSIGMPVHNGARYLRGAVESFLAQSFTDFELIISDNASTDRTEAIAREFARNDPRIRYIRQARNIGAVANFAFVLHEARGEFFQWAAHDDLYAKKFLEATVSVMDEYNEAGLVFCDMIQLNRSTGEQTLIEVGGSGTNDRLKRYLIRLMSPCPGLVYGLHRKNLLEQIPFSNFDYWDLHVALWYELFSSIKVIPSPLYTFGTEGNRIPYPLGGEVFDCAKFLKLQKKLLNIKFDRPESTLLYIILRNIYRKKDRRLQKIRHHMLQELNN